MWTLVQMEATWDCVIIGGGAAGLSAALVLGRARQRTLVIDAGTPSNLPAEGIGGLLGHDGVAPSELYAAGRRELGRYPSLEVRLGEVVAAARTDGGITLELGGGARERARRVLLATGMTYERPRLPGIEERWGRSVFHCPFCHGWELRDRQLGVLGSGATGVQRALLLREWSSTVTLYSNGPADLEPADHAMLQAAGLPLDERPVVELVGQGAGLRALRLSDGTEEQCEGLLVPVVLKQPSALAVQLGITLAEPGTIARDHLQVDGTFRTNIAEVYAAGDNAGMPSVANAVAAGSTAAAMIVHDLVTERHRDKGAS